jgi:hypothetical protein
MPTTIARLDAITFGEGDYDLQMEMSIDLGRLKVVLLRIEVVSRTRH